MGSKSKHPPAFGKFRSLFPDSMNTHLCPQLFSNKHWIKLEERNHPLTASSQQYTTYELMFVSASLASVFFPPNFCFMHHNDLVLIDRLPEESARDEEAERGRSTVP